MSAGGGGTPLRALRWAGWLFVVTGLGHGTLVGAGSVAEQPAAERATRELMRSTTVPVAGLERSYWELFQGFSILMAVLLVGVGALVLMVLRREPALAAVRSFAVLCALVAASALVISILLLPPPPIVTMGLASAATVVAAASRRGPVPPGRDRGVVGG